MTTRKILLIVAFIASVVCPTISAQSVGREQWMDQINQYRRSYFIKELGLSPQQQSKFLDLYDEMTERNNQIDVEVRTMERRVAEATDATDLEYEKAVEAIYDAKVQEAQNEKEYMLKFKEILTPKQLFELPGVEKKFSREMVRQHNRLRGNRNKGK